MRELGAAIRHARRKKGLSQRELARLTGYGDTYIAQIELGRQRGSPAALVKIANALDIPLKVIAAEFGFNPAYKKDKLTPADYRLISLPPEVKDMLLDIAIILERRHQS